MSRPARRHLRPATRRRAAGAGCWPAQTGARGADGAAQRRAAAADRRHPGPGARRVRQRRGDGPRHPRGPGRLPRARACSRWPCMSTAFTGLAIGTGFERRYGALKRLGASPLPRGALLGAKALAVLIVEALQVLLLGAVALALGWEPARVVGRRPGPAARRHRRVQRARPADGRHPAGRGDPGRRQPRLPAVPGQRRDRGARSTGSPTAPGRCSRRCPPARCPRGCARCCATAARCRGGRSACWPPGRPSAASSPPAPSAGSEPRPPVGWRAMLDRWRGWTPQPHRRTPGVPRRAGRERRDRRHRRRGPADRLRAGLPDLPALHRRQPGRDPRDGRARARSSSATGCSPSRCPPSWWPPWSWPGGRGRRDLRTAGAGPVRRHRRAGAARRRHRAHRPEPGDGDGALPGVGGADRGRHGRLRAVDRPAGAAPAAGPPRRAARRPRPARGRPPCCCSPARSSPAPARTRATRTPPTGCRSTWSRSPSCTPTWSSCSSVSPSGSASRCAAPTRRSRCAGGGPSCWSSCSPRAWSATCSTPPTCRSRWSPRTCWVPAWCGSRRCGWCSR